MANGDDDGTHWTFWDCVGVFICWLCPCTLIGWVVWVVAVHGNIFGGK